MLNKTGIFEPTSKIWCIVCDSGCYYTGQARQIILHCARF